MPAPHTTSVRFAGFRRRGLFQGGGADSAQTQSRATGAGGETCRDDDSGEPADFTGADRKDEGSVQLETAGDLGLEPVGRPGTYAESSNTPVFRPDPNPSPL